MNRTRKNIGANYIGQAWGLISTFLFVPFYISFLGMESYGLIGFYITLMGVLAFADIGLTATITREMARLSSETNAKVAKCNLLKTFELTYFGISCVLALLLWFLAPYIANEWLQTKDIPSSELIFVIRLMGLSIALQLPANLYIGGLMGLQKQVVANSIQIFWSMLRGVGSVLVLWQVSSSITAFIFWQLISNVIYFLFSRGVIWRAIRTSESYPCYKWSIVRNTWRYASGMAGMSLISILLLQADKMVVSKFLSLEILGYYMLAATLASIPGMLGRPIVRALFPQFTELVEAKDNFALVRLYHSTSEFLAIAIIPAGLTAILFSRELLFVWTGSTAVAEQTWQVSSLLISGALLQSMTAVPFYVTLAHGDVRLNLKVGGASVILLLPLLFILVPEYGLLGAGFSWFIMNIITFLPYMYFIHRRFLSGEFLKWSVRSIAIPLFCSLPFLILGYVFLPSTDSRIFMLFWIGFFWSISVCITVLVIPEQQKILRTKIKKIIGVFQSDN